ncbi:MAG: YcjF family protein [Pseudomonadota bacterium]
MNDGGRKPVLIEVADDAAETPATAAPVPDAPADGRAMRTVAAIVTRRPSRIGRFFWASFAGFLGFWISVAAWTFVADLFARNPAIGWIAAGLTGLFLLALLLVAGREVVAFLRLTRLDALHRDAVAAADTGDLAAARDVVGRIDALYRGRAEVEWGRARLAERRGEVMDADTLLSLAEAEVLAPLDQAARREIEAAARQVAAVTALVPLALADVAAALAANLRMIRRIAELYGGRAGTFGGWRLTRAVFTHLLATGAVAAGDDLIHSMAGGGLLSKLSRRFGEGVVNGALTARVGIAAMEVCRPLPFRALPRPRVSALVSRGLTGLFSRDGPLPGDAGAGPPGSDRT